MKMKAIVKSKPEFGGTEIKTVEVPKIGPKDVLVKIKVASICGTDVHIYEWNKWARNRIKPPLIYGHEFGGDIAAVGSDVTHLKKGDYVSGECHIACGHCYMCRNDMRHVCQNLKIFGVDVDGIFAEYAAIPAANILKNDPELPPELASIQDPLGNAVHTVFSADVPGRNVAVLGCGPLGLMAVAICRHIGAARIFAVEPNEYRLNLAKKLGADCVMKPDSETVHEIMEKTEGIGADVVLEMSGAPRALSEGLKMLRCGGRMSILGIYAEPVGIDVSNDIVFKGINITGIIGRRMFQTWYRMKGLLKGGLDVKPIITHRFKFEDFEKAMAAMRSGKSGKVVLEVRA